jgi:hypothetical protein
MSWSRAQCLFNLWQLRSCPIRAPSPTRGRVCLFVSLASDIWSQPPYLPYLPSPPVRYPFIVPSFHVHFAFRGANGDVLTRLNKKTALTEMYSAKELPLIFL